MEIIISSKKVISIISPSYNEENNVLECYERVKKIFTSEVITLLKLIDSDVVNSNTLYGSWAGAFGNFQFMPSKIKNYAVDFDNDNVIDVEDTNPNNAFVCADTDLDTVIHPEDWKKYKKACFIY